MAHVTTFGPQGKALARVLTTIRSREQKKRYVITGFILSAFRILVASIPLGTITMVVGSVLQKNGIRARGYIFSPVSTLRAGELPVVNFFGLIRTQSISIIPPCGSIVSVARSTLIHVREGRKCQAS